MLHCVYSEVLRTFSSIRFFLSRTPLSLFCLLVEIIHLIHDGNSSMWIYTLLYESFVYSFYTIDLTQYSLSLLIVPQYEVISNTDMAKPRFQSRLYVMRY